MTDKRKTEDFPTLAGDTQSRFTPTRLANSMQAGMAEIEETPDPYKGLTPAEIIRIELDQLTATDPYFAKPRTVGKATVPARTFYSDFLFSGSLTSA